MREGLIFPRGPTPSSPCYAPGCSNKSALWFIFPNHGNRLNVKFTERRHTFCHRRRKNQRKLRYWILLGLFIAHFVYHSKHIYDPSEGKFLCDLLFAAHSVKIIFPL